MSTLTTLLTTLASGLEDSGCLQACEQLERTFSEDYRQLLHHLKDCPSELDHVLVLLRDAEKNLHSLCRRHDVRSKAVEELLTGQELKGRYRALRHTIFTLDERQRIGDEAYDRIVKVSNYHATCVARVRLLLPQLRNGLPSEPSDNSLPVTEAPTPATSDTSDELSLAETDFNLRMESDDRPEQHPARSGSRKLYEIEVEGNTLILITQPIESQILPVELQNAMNDLHRRFEDPSLVNLVVDFENVRLDKIRSIITGVIARLARKVKNDGGQVVLCNVSHEVQESLETMRLGRLWSFVPSREKAVQWLFFDSLTSTDG